MTHGKKSQIVPSSADQPRRKLPFHKETLRQLNHSELSAAVGGGNSNGCVSYNSCCHNTGHTVVKPDQN